MPRTILIVSAFTFIVGNLCIAAEPISFCRDVAPILQNNCVACHSAKKAEGGYRVDNYDELSQAGDSGEAPLASNAGEPAELLRRLTCQDESERMPAESDPLSEQQIEIIKIWIEAGAKFDGVNSSDPLARAIPAPRYADPPVSYSRPIPIMAVCFSADGQQLLVGGYHELTVWNVSDAKLVRRIKNLGQRVFSIALDSSGKTIAVGCGEPGRSGELRLIDVESGDVKGVLARTTDAVLDAAFRPGKQEIAIASADSLIRIYDVETLEEIRTIASHADWVNAVAWSDDGKLLVSASRDKTAKVFDGQSGDLLSSYAGHGAAVRGVSFLPDGKQIVSVGADKKLHRWNIEAADRVAIVEIGGEPFKLIRRDNFVIVPGSDQLLRRIDFSENQVECEFSGHTDWVLSATLDSSGTHIASGAFNGEIRVWNLADGSLVNSWIAKP